MKYKIEIDIPEDLIFDPKNKPFWYRITESKNDEFVYFEMGIKGSCDTAQHAFEQANQRLKEYLSDKELFYE